MKRSIAVLALLSIAGTTSAQDLATCRVPAGYACFPERGLVTAKDSGWTKDAITDGMLSRKKVGNDDYDILILDATKQLRSTKSDGGVVKLFRIGDNEMALSCFTLVAPSKFARACATPKSATRWEC